MLKTGRDTPSRQSQASRGPRRWDTIVRSGLLAVVAAALVAPLSLLAGAITFYIRARMGWVDPSIGFEPNLFLRRFGLPLSGIVFAVSFAVALWGKAARSDHRKIGSS